MFSKSFTVLWPFTRAVRCFYGIKNEKVHHGLINYIDAKAKCRPLKKNWPPKELCGRCLAEFIDWTYSQCVFSTQFCELLPLLSSWTLPPPPFSLCEYDCRRRTGFFITSANSCKKDYTWARTFKCLWGAQTKHIGMKRIGMKPIAT
jgi:hypothetical protein